VTSRRLSQLLAIALAALTYWMMVSRPGVVGDDFVGTIYAAFFVVTLVVFGLSFLALRLAAGGTATYWTQYRTDQVRPILLMEFATVTVMLAARTSTSRGQDQRTASASPPSDVKISAGTPRAVVAGSIDQ
jgi:hypothetical protein